MLVAMTQLQRRHAFASVITDVLQVALFGSAAVARSPGNQKKACTVWEGCSELLVVEDDLFLGCL